MREQITIRRSTQQDEAEIRQLALLDDRAAPSGDAMLAFVDGELRAAMPLAGHNDVVARNGVVGHNGVVADPFHLTANLVDVLQIMVAREAA
jgi:hypothetical protein